MTFLRFFSNNLNYVGKIMKLELKLFQTVCIEQTNSVNVGWFTTFIIYGKLLKQDNKNTNLYL